MEDPKDDCQDLCPGPEPDWRYCISCGTAAERLIVPHYSV